MGDTSENRVIEEAGILLKKPSRHICVGILAHVDAGKTTLSEAVLYTSGSIRKMGRVDNKDAFFDTHELERSRGITIFSKQAHFTLGDIEYTLLDTPGHVDFSAEMERTLQVLDYAILVINGGDGVQGHTFTLWRLLKKYKIPVFIFINKMDQKGTDKQKLMLELKTRLSEECLDFENTDTQEFYENAAVADEKSLEYFLENGKLEREMLEALIAERKIFPCYFGSALLAKGVDAFLKGLHNYKRVKEYPDVFSARVFKVSRDSQGNRLTWLKITGGSLQTKTVIKEEKINQIRIYAGEKYTAVENAQAGCICTVTGLSGTSPGEGLGAETKVLLPELEPVLTYQIELPQGYDAALALPKLRQLEEEEPELHIEWNETLKEIQAKLMGEVQTEVLKSLIQERYGIEVSFGAGNIVYKETIADRVEGVGHFEPLRHYAEVHLLLEPGAPGSGMEFYTDCSEDILDRNWQRLIMTHLKEREHKGVLTGAPLTDMRITLLTGRAHQKHTEGGDFRQATYRAVRQGLMQARSVLLEPFYNFRLEVPENMTGRAMTDIEKMSGTFELPQTESRMTVLTGYAPVSSMKDYQKEVNAYTKGYGRLFCTLRGYEPCHNMEEVMAEIGYEPERDIENPSSSVFCAHGAGFIVEWENVKDYMHVDSGFSRVGDDEDNEPENGTEQNRGGALTGRAGNLSGEAGNSTGEVRTQAGTAGSQAQIRRQAGIRRQAKQQKQDTGQRIGTEEIDAILARTYYANTSGNKSNNPTGKAAKGWKYKKADADMSVPPEVRTWKKTEKKEEYLLVDGYNIIFAWEELSELAKVSIDGARGRLMDILCNYQAVKRCKLILVFDAYRVQGHDTELLDYHNIHVVYTKEAETADQYIEKFAHEHGRSADVTVATSDGLEQIIIRGQGCRLLSARELLEEIKRAGNLLKEEYQRKNKEGRLSRNYLFDGLSEEARQQIADSGHGSDENHEPAPG